MAYDFQAAMAAGKERAQRERNRGEASSPFRCHATAKARYGDLTEEEWRMMQSDMSEDDWEEHLEAGGDGNPPPADEPRAKTEEAKPRRSPGRKSRRSVPEYQPMSPAEYKAACEALGVTIYGSARVLGISLPMAYRYAGRTVTEEYAIPETVAKLLRALVELGRTDV